ncbi:ArsR/SmtB family transcription factor [Sanguibacter antarcticus]|nr:helix-turn-helix domain-containing protein [Sanguibacter antarcticus]
MTENRSVRTLRPDDTAALRALAHPARLAILGELRTNGPATVGTLAHALTIAPGSASYHLTVLAEHGFVGETDDRPPGRPVDKRSRWWRATDRTTSWEPSDVATTPEAAAAARELEASILGVYHDRALAALDRRPALDPAWQRTHLLADDNLPLTVTEAAELRAELEALVGRWSARALDRPRSSEPTMPVTLIVQTFPDPTSAP